MKVSRTCPQCGRGLQPLQRCDDGGEFGCPQGHWSLLSLGPSTSVIERMEPPAPPEPLAWTGHRTGQVTVMANPQMAPVA